MIVEIWWLFAAVVWIWRLDVGSTAAVSAPPAIANTNDGGAAPLSQSDDSTTSTLPNATHLNSTVSSKKTLFPVDGTDMFFLFNYFSDPIPIPDYESAFHACIIDIAEHITLSARALIPYSRYVYDTGAVHIAFINNRGEGISWLVLFQMFQALNSYVTEKGSEHYQIMHWEIWMAGKGQVGIGYLWYYPGKKGMATS